MSNGPVDVLTAGGDDDSEYPDVTDQDLLGHEEIDLTPEQEAALDAAWEGLDGTQVTGE